MSRSVVIVGRPNVGKSRLFNRLARRRVSIVHDQPGITRDVLSVHVEDGGYELLDTGGLGFADGGVTKAALIAESERQAHLAVDSSALVLFVIDGLEGITALDQRIADRLRKIRGRVVLVMNKADFGLDKVALGDAQRLGFGDPICVSAEHGTNEAALRAAILERIGPDSLGLDAPAEGGAGAAGEAAPAGPGAEGDGPGDADGPDGAQGGGEGRAAGRRGGRARPEPGAAGSRLCICFIGRPNVGKSSLSNRLLGSDRLIVSDVPGTTRDAVELDFDFIGRDRKPHPFRLIDTAGIKASTKLASPVEYFSRLRSLEAMQRADVVFLVLDAMDGVTQQDKAIAGEAVKDRKPIVLVVNKWDLVHSTFRKHGSMPGYKDEREYRKKYEHALFDRLFFTPGAPLVYVSAMSGYEVDRMLNAAVRLNRVLDKKLPTARLNATLAHLTERTPPPAIGARRFRIYYATQTGNRPFRIKLFCNREERLAESYRRYLEAGLVEEFGLDGCPIEFELVGKPRAGTGAGEPGGRDHRARPAHGARTHRGPEPRRRLGGGARRPSPPQAGPPGPGRARGVRRPWARPGPGRGLRPDPPRGFHRGAPPGHAQPARIPAAGLPRRLADPDRRGRRGCDDGAVAHAHRARPGRRPRGRP